MAKPELGEVIVERSLDFIGSDGTSTRCSVRVGVPVPVEDGDWVCPYQLRAGDRVRSMGMHGIDSMQALVLTMKTLDVEITHMAKKFDASVRFLDGSHNSVLDP